MVEFTAKKVTIRFSFSCFIFTFNLFEALVLISSVPRCSHYLRLRLKLGLELKLGFGLGVRFKV